MKNALIVTICLLAVVATLSGCISQPPGPGAAQVSFKATANDSIILDKAITVPIGTNAFEAMQQAATIEYTDYGEMGKIVNSINGTTAPENYYWKLIVDGQDSPVGITSIVIGKDTAIEWVLEEIMFE